MGKVSCKCQCMDCVNSREWKITRGCDRIFCTIKHCATCTKVMSRCSSHKSHAEFEKEEEMKKAAKGRK